MSEPDFELSATAADPEAYRAAMACVAAIRERARPARERRAAREAETAAWEASLDDAVDTSLNSVLTQRHSPLLGPLPRQRERTRRAIAAAVGRWFRDVHPTIRAADYPDWADPALRSEYVGQPAHDPAVFPWNDPAILAVASVLGDGPVIAQREIQNHYLPKVEELSWMDDEELNAHIAAAEEDAAKSAKYIDFDSDRCLRDGQEQK